jgi:hypothetical protein
LVVGRCSVLVELKNLSEGLHSALAFFEKKNF